MEKIALITAASRGMGAACTRELADAGYITGQNLRVDGGITRSV